MAEGLGEGQVHGYSDNDTTDTFHLRIVILNGQSLAKKDIFGASDPYVRIDLNTINGDINIDSVLTKTKKKTLNPTWNEEFVFRVKPTEHKLVFQVFDENRLTRDDFLGMVELTLVNLPTELEGRTIAPQSYPLRPRSAKSRIKGTLEIYHAFIHEQREPAEPDANSGDWEHVENVSLTGATQTTNAFVANGSHDPLPAGWEERQDANGRTYYVNHTARTTQWERPTTMNTNHANINMEAAASDFQRRFHISVDDSETNRATFALRNNDSDISDRNSRSPTNHHNLLDSSGRRFSTFLCSSLSTDSSSTNESSDAADSASGGERCCECGSVHLNSDEDEAKYENCIEPKSAPSGDGEAVTTQCHNTRINNETHCDILDKNLHLDRIFDTLSQLSSDDNTATVPRTQSLRSLVSNDSNSIINTATTTSNSNTNGIDRSASNSENSLHLRDASNNDPADEQTRFVYNSLRHPTSRLETSATSLQTDLRPVRQAAPIINAYISLVDHHPYRSVHSNSTNGVQTNRAAGAASDATARTISQTINPIPRLAMDNLRNRNNMWQSSNEDGDQTDSGNRSQTSASSTRRNSVEENSAAPTEQPAPSADEEPLPPRWSMQVAPNGRTFFIDHASRRTTWIDPRNGRASPMPNQTRRVEDDLGPLPEGWEERVHTDGRVFYIDHNTRTTQWEDPRLSNPNIAGQAVPYSRDYKQKYEYFKNHLRRPTNVPNKFEIRVRRTSILEDSYRIISQVTKTDLLKTKLWVEFEGETGLDYGGLAREWFYLLSKEMFNPYYGLFEYSAMDNYTLQINNGSGLCNEDHLHYFKFIGRIAGMAVYHGKLLDAFFIRPFYKMMLQKPIDLKDMESVDTEYYNSLMWIKENDPRQLELTFCVDEDTFGQKSQHELKPGGANIEVTDENKDEYIKLVIEWRFVARVKDQMTAFLEGFGSIITLNLIKIFDEHELELLMCGIQNIDVKDWRENTLYKGDYHQNHIIIQWFWRAVLSFPNEMRSRLLQFVTGTSRVPMNGFKELYGSNGPQMFTIEKWGTPNNYPRAHTCFNRLDLPPYEGYLQLKDKLIKAIEGSQGFAGVD